MHAAPSDCAPGPDPGEPPQLARERCVACISPLASCRACAAACPSAAWRIAVDGPRLDESRCDGCGRCVGVCPQQALSVPGGIERRSDARGLLGLAVCAAVAKTDDAPCLPCLHQLGWRELVAWREAGIDRLYLESGDCDHCARGGSDLLADAIASARRVWAERGVAPPTIRRLGPGARLRLRAASDAADGRGIGASRRGLWRRLTRTVAPDVAPAGHARFAPSIDARRCAGCDACARLCPTAALSLDRNDDVTSYVVEPHRCSGCGLCADVCEVAAVVIEDWAPAAHSRLPLAERRCRSCGARFHEPVADLEPRTHCAVCTLRPAVDPRLPIVAP